MLQKSVLKTENLHVCIYLVSVGLKSGGKWKKQYACFIIVLEIIFKELQQLPYSFNFLRGKIDKIGRKRNYRKVNAEQNLNWI